MTTYAEREMHGQPDCTECGEYQCYAAMSGANIRFSFSPDGERYIGISFDRVKECRAQFRQSIGETTK